MPLLLIPSSSGGATLTYSDLASGTMGASAFIVTFDGCPYYFTEPGVGGTVSWTGARDPDWCGAGDAVQWTNLAVLDASKGFAWTETVEPLDGVTRVSGLTFRLQSYSTLDALIANSETIGDASTALAASATAAASTLTLADGGAFGSANFTVWVDREAVRISSRTGTALTVASGGRGAYGSRAAAHNLDAEDGYAPEVFAAFPGFARRRVVLWLGRLSGTAIVDPVPLWRGLVTSAPRLADDLAAWELPCEHVTTALRDVRIGMPSPGVRVQGYSSSATYLFLALFTADPGGVQATAVAASQHATYRSLQELVQTLSAKLTARLAVAGITGTVVCSVEGGAMVFRVASVTATSYAALHVNAWANRETGSLVWDGATTLDPTRTLTIPTPGAFVECGRSTATAIPLASVAELPATGWGQYYASDGPGLTVRSMQVLVSAQRDGMRLVLAPETADVLADTVIDAAARTFRGVATLYDSAGRPSGEEIDGVFVHQGRGAIGGTPVDFTGGFICAPITFALSLVVEASSWPYALRAALVEDTILAGSNASIDCDPDDWSWDRVEALRSALGEDLQRRRWVFDGSQTLGDLLGEELKLAGGLLSLRRSRLAPAPLLVPTRSDAYDAAHTLDVREEVSGKPAWSQSPDGIINVADVTYGAEGGSTMRLLVTDRRSVAKYGKRNVLEVEARGVAIDEGALAAGPDLLARTLLARTLGLWSEPVEYVQLTVPAQLVDTIYLGDAVRFADWVLPNGTGSRGLAANTYRAGVVVGRAPALGPQLGMRLTLAVWGSYARAAGWSPCCRISAISSATLTVATGYVAGTASDGPTDYAGSNLSGYARTVRSSTGATVANDGGTGWFVAGDRVRLVRRDVTTATTSSGIVAGVTAATKTIVLQAAPGGSWPGWASGGIVDLVFDEYATAGLLTTQEDFAWIGDRATRVVDGTTESLTRWAP